MQKRRIVHQIDQRLILWPVRFVWTKHYFTFCNRGKVYAGHIDKGVELFGYFLRIGPIKVVLGKPRESKVENDDDIE